MAVALLLAVLAPAAAQARTRTRTYAFANHGGLRMTAQRTRNISHRALDRAFDVTRHSLVLFCDEHGTSRGSCDVLLRARRVTWCGNAYVRARPQTIAVRLVMTTSRCGEF